VSDSAKLDLRGLGPAGVLAAIWLIAPAALGFALLASLGAASDWLTSLGSGGPIVFAAIFAVTCGFGLLPTYAQAVLGGWVFGVAIGLPAALVGFVGGSLIGWCIARVVSRRNVEQAIERHKQASVIRAALVGRGFWKTLGIVSLLRIPPNSPFALTNLALAACGVRLPAYLLGTMIGMTPRTAVVIIVSAAAAASGAKDLQSFIADGPGLWVFIGGVVVLIIVLMIIASIAKRALTKIQQS
jgi:uncharacterized membrane protein YdjX (TVP38/TMEM64 family)